MGAYPAATRVTVRSAFSLVGDPARARNRYSRTVHRAGYSLDYVSGGIEDLPHSCLNATSGSTLEAQRAGT
jgi:hypothetical protein